MKTTLDIPDALLRDVKVRAAREGQTMRSFVIDAVKTKLYSGSASDESPVGWRSVFGSAAVATVGEVQDIIDKEFSQIDPEEWK